LISTVLRAKRLWIVNVVPNVAYTKQYAAIQNLNEPNTEIKSFILGAFLPITSGDKNRAQIDEIKEFVSNRIRRLPSMLRSFGQGFDKHPLYRSRLSDSNLKWFGNNEEPGWNFCIFLIDEKRDLVKFLLTFCNS